MLRRKQSNNEKLIYTASQDRKQRHETRFVIKISCKIHQTKQQRKNDKKIRNPRKKGRRRRTKDNGHTIVKKLKLFRNSQILFDKEQTTEKTTDDMETKGWDGERRGAHKFAVTLSFYDHLLLEEYCF